MCKDWILNPVRTLLRTKLSQGNYSPIVLAEQYDGLL